MLKEFLDCDAWVSASIRIFEVLQHIGAAGFRDLPPVQGFLHTFLVVANKGDTPQTGGKEETEM